MRVSTAPDSHINVNGLDIAYINANQSFAGDESGDNVSDFFKYFFAAESINCND